MPWYIPTILVPALVLSAWFGLKAFNEIAKGADPFKTLILGIWASEEDFTPRGRRYRMWSLAILGAGILLAIMAYLVASLSHAAA
jgi:hypothetical protein